MEIMSKNGFEVFFDEKSDKARTLAVLITEGCPYSHDEARKLVIVAGGDGTMLAALHHYNFEPVFLGVNSGHRGFLLNDDNDTINKIIGRKFEIHEFPLLEVQAENWKGLALDVYFNRVSGKTCKAKVVVDGTTIDERISGDGIIISSSLGSSGYFLATTGVAVHSRLPVIAFAPIIPNAPFQITPIVFPMTSVLEVNLLSPPEEVKGWYDAIELPYFKKLTIRKAAKTLKLAFWQGEDFTARLVNKIMKIQEG